jgi:hypothetical protein
VSNEQRELFIDLHQWRLQRAMYVDEPPTKIFTTDFPSTRSLFKISKTTQNAKTDRKIQSKTTPEAANRRAETVPTPTSTTQPSKKQEAESSHRHHPKEIIYNTYKLCNNLNFKIYL